MLARDVIKRPIVTEKSMHEYENHQKVTFEVAKGVNRTQVKQAVEEIFKVKVEKVNMINTKPKTKRVGRNVGKTSAITKAIVKIAEGHEIKLFD